jgi:hypothetical protein
MGLADLIPGLLAIATFALSAILSWQAVNRLLRSKVLAFVAFLSGMIVGALAAFYVAVVSSCAFFDNCL